jgi:hypothetical protein
VRLTRVLFYTWNIHSLPQALTLRIPLRWNPVYLCFCVTECHVVLTAPSPYYSVRDVHRCITRHVTLRPTSLLQETTITPYVTIITLGIVHCLRLTLHMTLRRLVLLPFSIGRSPLNRGVNLSQLILRLLVTIANRCMTHEYQSLVLTTLSPKKKSPTIQVLT